MDDVILVFFGYFSVKSTNYFQLQIVILLSRNLTIKKCIIGKWKIILGMGMQFSWPLSRMFVVLVAWLLLHWRRIMQVYR